MANEAIVEFADGSIETYADFEFIDGWLKVVEKSDRASPPEYYYPPSEVARVTPSG